MFYTIDSFRPVQLKEIQIITVFNKHKENFGWIICPNKTSTCSKKRSGKIIKIAQRE